MTSSYIDLLREFPHLVERTRTPRVVPQRSTGEFVLYWLHHAMRAHENPALDVAVTISNRLRLPLLVYQALPERYPYASDRHHMFMLEGARNLEQQFREREIAYAFHLERREQRGAHLRHLCDRAAVLITEEMPVQPLRNWTYQLAATADTQSALATMIDLNHRYALDGRDPASYGGILWCLGQFDRPFAPARPILGTVRDRSTEEHAKRLDVARYQNHTTRPLHKLKVAVVGAGIAGLMCGRTLVDHGIEVKVFEKSRGVGGRMATRRTSEGPRFDHGAQYFTVRDAHFERYVKSWTHDGIVAPWKGRIATLANGQVEWKEQTTPRFVGVPGMNAVCRHLASDLKIDFQVRAAPPRLVDGSWRITDDQGQRLGEFDYFVTSAPSSQSAELLAAAPQLRELVPSVEMNGCWAVMVAFEDGLNLPFDGAFVHQSPLSWIARNDNKPGRSDEQECWVLLASPEWTTQNIEVDPQQALLQLMDAFWQATGIAARTPDYSAIHRWRYAIPPEPLANRCLFEPELRIGACGDWCGGPRVEGALLSGMAMAGRVLTHAPEWS